MPLPIAEDAPRPRSDVERERRSGVNEDAARPVPAPYLIRGWIPSELGKAARREAASLLVSRRPARVEAAARLRVSHAAGMSSRPGRKTHSDRPGEDEAQNTLRPLGPKDEAIRPHPPDRSTNGGAINSHRQPGVQRPRRSTPAAERCPTAEGLVTPTAERVQGEKDLSLQPTGRGRGRRAYHSNHRPALPAKGFITPHRQHPSWATFVVQPGLEGNAPRFLGRETLEKPETASIITASKTP